MDTRQEIKATLAKLLQRRAELEEAIIEAHRLDGAIHGLESSLKCLDEGPPCMVSSLGNGSGRSISAETGQTLLSTTTHVGPDEQSRAGRIVDILREHGGKMRASEIQRILNERGDKVSQAVLANAVMRKIDVLFRRPERGVYELIETGNLTGGENN